MPIAEFPYPFAVGSRVRTSQPPSKAWVIRTVTTIQIDGRLCSGWSVEVDGGDPCPCCGRRPAGRGVYAAQWIIPVEKEKVQ